MSASHRAVARSRFQSVDIDEAGHTAARPPSWALRPFGLGLAPGLGTPWRVTRPSVRVPALSDAGIVLLAFCVLHLLVWTLTPALTYESPPRDSLEGIAWGRLWLFGYEKHPFLAPWLTAALTESLGSVTWPVYLGSQLCVLTCFASIWLLARRMMGPWHALIAVLVLDGVYYYNFGAIALNPNVLMLPTWALTILAFHSVLRAPSRLNWVLTGLCAGLATLAKYESAMLFGVMIGMLIVMPEGRRAARHPGFTWGVAAAVLTVLPNLAWLVRHDFAPFHYALGNMAFEQNTFTETEGAELKKGLLPGLNFLLSQLGAVLPALLLYLPFIAWPLGGRVRASGRSAVHDARRDAECNAVHDAIHGAIHGADCNAARDFDRRFILMMTLGPLLLTSTFMIVTRAEVVARWGFPFFSTLGIALLVFFPPALSTRRWRAFGLALCSLMLFEVLGNYWVIKVRPLQTGEAPYSTAYPGRTIARVVDRLWDHHADDPLKYVIGDRWTIATVIAHAEDRPTPYFEGNEFQSPWILHENVLRDGGVLIQPLDEAGAAQTIERLRRQFAPVVHEAEMSFEHDTDAKVPPVRLWIGVVPPRRAQIAKPHFPR